MSMGTTAKDKLGLDGRNQASGERRDAVCRRQSLYGDMAFREKAFREKSVVQSGQKECPAPDSLSIDDLQQIFSILSS